jgi:oxygen-independent coproporphyrinogen-3 oxidase
MTSTLQVGETGSSKIPEASLLSLYVHIPFCQTRCSYCAFNTYTGMNDLIEPFVTALCREVALVASSASTFLPPAHTLYFGGGTPSLLTPDQIARIITAMREHIGLTKDAEITLEVNPGTASTEKLNQMRTAGVNRLSIGVQSAHQSELDMFNRSHNFAEASGAFDAARAAGFDNVSIDLIYGIPNQTRADWCSTLDQTLQWQPDHISLYSLTLEPHTQLEWQVNQRIYPYPDSDLAADMYADAREMTSRAGFVQYEISNWARAGKESRHNCQYWLNWSFLGFGPGAHGAVCDLRYWNIRPVKSYIEQIMKGIQSEYPFSPALAEFQMIAPDVALAETIILGLRLVNRGVSYAEFERRFGKHPRELWRKAITKLIKQGLLVENGDRLSLTEQAYLVSNRVFVEFIPIPISDRASKEN